jgi:hypothetical protein
MHALSVAIVKQHILMEFVVEQAFGNALEP